jgi:mannose-6-phosphate isomerase-like protein (cupin superfamily)
MDGNAVGLTARRIVVEPGRTIDLRARWRRGECWAVVRGRGRLRVSGKARAVSEGDTFLVYSAADQRIFNPGPLPLEIMRVQPPKRLRDRQRADASRKLRRRDRMVGATVIDPAPPAT